MQVTGRIDWNRRLDHMQQHTGQHILSQVFLQLLEARTEGFHLGPEVSSIDLSLEHLRTEEIYQVEDLTNRIIVDDREIKIHFIDSGEQDRFPIRKPSLRTGQVRLIEIEDFDYSPCGGTHCGRTGSVGLLKIRKWEKVNQRVRIEFFCGGRALKDYRWKNRAMYRLARLFSKADREVVGAVEKQLEKEKMLRKQFSRLQEELLGKEADILLGKCRVKNGVRIVSQVWDDLELKNLQKLASMIANGGEKRVVLFGLRRPKPTLLFGRSLDLTDFDVRGWIAQVSPLIEGKGGGTPDRAQAGGTRVEGLDEALRQAGELVGPNEALVTRLETPND
jgi:alanyl-tRNA synthetase